ncbi:hypothetical protein CY652_04825 [Burkholderia sp. WAC0059]|uniref:hypothetical protein n=1 Tax=Burkholderia sp. WAC0059 TaxID=2066022 RepID=UPI000C7EB479|nr:hypothetical protein [Burkholderia sp. WAC0059]PLZ03707.1 hypothetical protein CY652_04825 [Burkholderia sp. WAC0059]
MKYLSLIVVTVAVSACASQVPPGVQSVGQSQQPVGTVAQCIAQKWANQSQQPVTSQVVTANDQALDVYAPGQQPPSGSAAMVRPAWNPSNRTWVGLRNGGSATGTGDVNGCL